MPYPTIQDQKSGYAGFSGEPSFYAPMPAFQYGDLIFASITFNLESDADPAFLAAENWTEIHESHSPSDLSLLMGYRVIDGTESWDGLGDADLMHCTCANQLYGTYQIINYGPVEYVDYAISQAEPSSAAGSWNPPELDVTDAEPLMWLAIVAEYDLTTVSTWPAAFTQNRAQVVGVGASGTTQAICRLDADASSQDPATYVLASESSGIAATLAFRPISYGGGWGIVTI